MVTAFVFSYQQDSVTVWSGKKVTVYELSGTVLRNTGITLTRPTVFTSVTQEKLS